MARFFKKSKNQEELEEENETSVKKNKLANLPFKTKIKVAVILVVAFILIDGLIMLTQTGIITIPVLSKILYHLPQPTRTIEITEPFQPTPDGFKLKASNQEGLLIVELGEKELTYIARKVFSTKPKVAVKGVDTTPKFGENLQTVITPDWIEIFGLQLKPFKANLTIKVQPEVVDTKFSYKILAYKIGDLKIHPALVNLARKFKKKSNNPQLEDLVFNVARLEKLELTDGKISMVAWVDAKAITGALLKSIGSPSN